MANKYVVIAGGNSNVDATWTLNADGTTNATTVPTSSDDILINSTAGNLVINAALACRSFDMTGYTGTLSGSGALTLTGPASTVNCLFTGTVTWTGLLTLNPASGGTINLTSAGKLGACTGLTINGTGTVSLQDNLVLSSTGDLTTANNVATKFTTNNYNITCRTFNLGNGMNIHHWGTSVITCIMSNGWAFSGSNPAIDSTDYEVILTGVNALFSQASTNRINKLSVTGGGNFYLESGGLFNSFTYIGTAIQTCSIRSGGSISCANTWTVNGNSAINRVLIYSTSIGTARTITLGASATCASVSNYVDIQDITMSGGAANERDFQTNSKSAGDCGGNTGITFTTAAEQTWSGATGNWSNSALWTSRIPLPQDNVVIPNPGAASRTLTADMPRLGKDITVTNTSAANRLTLALTNQDITLYGTMSLVNNTYMFFNSSKNIYFAGRSNASLTCAGSSFGSRTIFVVKPGATLTFNDAVANSLYYLNLVNGTLTTDYSVTVRQFVAYTGTTLNMGSGTWTLQGNGTDWNANAATINGQTSTIAFVNTDSTASLLALGTGNYNDIVITPGSGVLTFSGAFTFHDMKRSGVGTKTINFTKNTNYTMTGTDFFKPISGTDKFALTGTGNGSTDAERWTLTNNTTRVDTGYIDITECKAAGSTSPFYAGANSTTDNATNTGWTFTAPPSPGATVDCVTMIATAAALVSGVAGNAALNATTAAIAAESLAAVIAGNAVVSSVQAMIDGIGLIPNVSGGALVAALASSGQASSPSSTVATSSAIQLIVAEAAAQAFAGSVGSGSSIAVTTAVSTATANALALEYAASAQVISIIAEAVANGVTLSYATSASVLSELAEALVNALPATARTEALKLILQRFNKLFGPGIGP